MAYTTLISTAELASHLDDPMWVIVDCRHTLADHALGERRYREGHIPGAVYASMERDLAAPVVPGMTGRHPLPEPGVLAATLGSWGVGEGVQVVAYDDAGGAMAARLWWMVRWLGHDAVAVLDGDFRAWMAEGRPVMPGIEHRAPRAFTPRVRANWVATTGEIAATLGTGELALFDARSAERYRGENETIDPKAGHIPGAISAPYQENLTPDGHFLPEAQLRARYAALLGERAAEECVFLCGSGVTAAHDLLALAHAGYAMPRLYVGSWSEWVADPARPVATGDQP
jgi:thiosulfate/3-mercaptopyruvate sulfurtransferase